MSTDIELIDELTNVVMGIVRAEFKVNPDSDYDDELYGTFHTALRETYSEIIGQVIE